jgi:hypothetical protein
VNPIVAIYRNSINYFYRHLHILFIIVVIVTIYTLSIKSPYSDLNIFSIMLPIASPYRLNIVSFYKHLYTKYIWITYNITYKGSLYFVIPGVSEEGNVRSMFPCVPSHNKIENKARDQRSVVAWS